MVSLHEEEDDHVIAQKEDAGGRAGVQKVTLYRVQLYVISLSVESPAKVRVGSLAT